MAEINQQSIYSKLSEEETRYLDDLILRDALTGAYNKRKFDEDIGLLIDMMNRQEDGGACFLYIDVDNFKKYNDTKGHGKGDELLRGVTGSVKQDLRSYDRLHIYRCGGDEFQVILPNTPLDIGRKIAERLRKKIEEECGVTVSIGMSHYKETSDNIRDFKKHADDAMYMAKNNGRNKVVVYGDPEYFT